MGKALFLVLTGFVTATGTAWAEDRRVDGVTVLIGAEPSATWISTKDQPMALRLSFPISVLPYDFVEAGIVPGIFDCGCRGANVTDFELRGRLAYVLQSYEGTAYLGLQGGSVFKDGDDWESVDAIAGMRAWLDAPIVFEFGLNVGWFYLNRERNLNYGVTSALRAAF